MGEEAQFRNAAWGGFNKEDVLRYIEMMKQSALETNMKLDQATRQLQDAQRRVQVLEAQLKQKTEEASRLAAGRPGSSGAVAAGTRASAALGCPPFQL